MADKASTKWRGVIVGNTSPIPFLESKRWRPQEAGNDDPTPWLPVEQPLIHGTNDRLIRLVTKPNPGPPTKPKEALDEAIPRAVPAEDES